MARAGRIEFLEAVRGVAASLVVLQHLLTTVYPAFGRWTNHHLDLGRVGVVAFFLVSGYVIPLSLAGQTPSTFAVRRFFRLFPVYWVALALYAALHPGGATGQVGAAGLVLNVLMLHGMLGILSVLPPAWTLSIELIFYTQAAAAKARRLLDASVYAGLGWLGLYLMLCAGQRVTGHDLPRTLPLLLFVASLGHALHQRDRGGSVAWRPLFAAGAVLVPAGAYLGGNPAGDWPPFTYSVSFLVGVGLFAAWYAARRYPVGRPLLFLGAISYAVYLVHPTVMDVLYELPRLAGGVPFLVATVVAVPLVAWTVHRLLERPSIRLGRLLTRRTPSPEASPAARPDASPAAP